MCAIGPSYGQGEHAAGHDGLMDETRDGLVDWNEPCLVFPIKLLKALIVHDVCAAAAVQEHIPRAVMSKDGGYHKWSCARGAASDPWHEDVSLFPRVVQSLHPGTLPLLGVVPPPRHVALVTGN